MHGGMHLKAPQICHTANICEFKPICAFEPGKLHGDIKRKLDL